jgi:hypothetical protein
VSKDILRAGQLALLNEKNKHFASNLLKVSSGQPSMRARRRSAPMWSSPTQTPVRS